ncbi:hypothetical protein [Methanolacinia paynteri]|uniref:hypothetical protein n=1 Tax=Methanolacinia paynteri TaxID=230356 RepID=UPI00064F3B54|nr:hypothetical protein [Methanolacinia paynteri]
MTDFIETSNSRSAVRELAQPIADITTFSAIIQSVIDENPFGCTEYSDNGATVPGVARNREHYIAKVVFEDTAGEKIGTLSVKCPSISAMESAAGAIVADADLAVAVGGEPVRDEANDTWSCQLKCHDANSDIYYVTFTRAKVRISGYEDDSVLSTVETWADSVAALA